MKNRAFKNGVVSTKKKFLENTTNSQFGGKVVIVGHLFDFRVCY